MAAATTIDLIINQKASFEVFFTVKTSNGSILDLTTYTTAAKYKENYQTPDTQSVDFTTQIVDAANGVMSISLSPAQTTAMQVGKYVYDVSITNSIDNYKTRIVEGRITVSGGVS